MALKKRGAQKRKHSEAGSQGDDDAAAATEGLSTRAVKAATRIRAWAEDSKQLQVWLDSRGGGLETRLQEASGGILALRDFLPLCIADAVLVVLEELNEERWELSQQDGEDQAAEHRFYSVDVMDVPELAPLRTVFWQMLPKYRNEPTLPIISAARYGKGGGIGRHDDRAHVPFFNDQVYSRVVAGIWYLTRDWTQKEGGCLVDLQAVPEEHKVPVYNSMVAFDVPHWHAVSKVLGDRYRYSIFGWWHLQGRLYDLPGEEGSGGGKPETAARRKGKRRKLA
mmetsp:Transcript_22074/g.40558  ORF Transcript_22074/g.40558 Transcript_22074/m.40558 type:complete len:281 (-) Transcript_22074:21-863(-)